MRGDFQKRVYENFNTNLMFIDSSASMERFNLPVFILSLPSPYGALPVATMIVSDETESTLKIAFSELRNFGIEVKNIMTDDCLPLRAALKFAWPNCELFLCSWHFTQAYWTWLIDKKHGFTKETYNPPMEAIRNLVYEKSATNFEEKLSKIREDYSAYTKFISKLDANLKRKEEWSHANRRNIKILIEIPSNFPFFKGPKTLDLV